MLHIVRAAEKRLLAIDCAESIGPDLETGRHGCWGLTEEFANPAAFYGGSWSEHPARPANLLPLLQTCRRIYQETICILYEDNIFDLNHVDTLAYLRRTVLPQRLDQIRVLNFTFYFKWFMRDVVPYDLTTWSETCNSLARLAGLEELKMHLTESLVLYQVGKPCQWAQILEPLMQIMIPKKFQVVVPLPEDSCLQMAREKNYPFQLLPQIDEPIELDHDYTIEI